MIEVHFREGLNGAFDFVGNNFDSVAQILTEHST